MGTTVERSKKKVQLWKKAIVHFMLCFVMGFFTGFAPTSKNSMLFSRVTTSNPSEFSPQPLDDLHRKNNINATSYNRNLLDGSTPVTEVLSPSDDHENKDVDGAAIPRRLIIVVTPTTVKDQLRGVHLRRLGNTLRLVAPPLLWVVVEQQSESSEVSEILRQTGIMYRHLVFKENFTDIQAEMDHQRNVALNHIEHHRLTGIVHFAGLSNVYDLNFFNEIRTIQVFGTWPMAFLSANRNKVKIEGPVCESSEVKGWHLKTMENLTDITNSNPSIHISSFAFNSSILWDPERWGRTSSAQDTSQANIIISRTIFFPAAATVIVGVWSGNQGNYQSWPPPRQYKLRQRSPPKRRGGEGVQLLFLSLFLQGYVKGRKRETDRLRES